MADNNILILVLKQLFGFYEINTIFLQCMTVEKYMVLADNKPLVEVEDNKYNSLKDTVLYIVEVVVGYMESILEH